MRVLLDVSAVPARPVGAGMYTVALASGLAARADVELHLVARRADKARWGAFAPTAVVHAVAPNRRPMRLAWEQARAPAIAKRVRPDVWHGPHYTMPLRSAVPCVVTIHDLTFFDHPEWHERSKVIYFRRMIRAAARRASVLVCVSSFTADRLRALVDPRADIVVAHHGVDHDRFTTTGDETSDLASLAAHGIEPPYIAFASTIEPRKNLPTLVRAFARVAASRPALRLVLAGSDGWGAREARDGDRGERRGDPDRAAGIPRERCGGRILSTRRGRRVPVVRGGVRASRARRARVRRTGRDCHRIRPCGGGRSRRVDGVDPDDPVALGDAIARVLDDPAVARRLRTAGPARAAGFTWERCVDQHIDAYKTRRGRRGLLVKALITGGAGFVGDYLRMHCTEAGDDVVTIDRSGSEPVDITDRDAIHASFARHEPEVVYHLAAMSHVGESWNDPTGVLRVNVEGTAHVLAAARETNVRRIVVVGSAEEYGQVDARDLPLREDAPLHPTSPYGVSKIAASFLALQAHLAYGLDVVRVRAFSHTGPGQSDRFLVPALAHRIAIAECRQHDEIRVGSTDPIRDISDVRDVVRAYRLLAEHGAAGAVYNVCSGSGVSVREIVDRLVASANRPLRVTTDPDLVRAVEVPCLIGDGSLLRAETGWSPEFDLDDTLATVLAHARTHLPA